MKVRFAYGQTINTGNYESKRIDVAVEDECAPGDYDEKAAEVYDKVIEFYNAAYKELLK